MKHLRSLFISISAFIVTAGVLFTVSRQAGLFEVMSIPIEVAGVNESRPVLGPLGLKSRAEEAVAPFTKKKIWEVDLASMKSAILRDEWVKSVLISRSFPNGLRIKIEPRATSLVLVGLKGELWPLSEDGGLLSSLHADAIPDVPLLRGEIFLTNVAKRKEAIAFMQELPLNGPASRKNVSELSWSKEDGFALMLMQPKVEVKLGEEHLAIKVLRVTQALNYMSAHDLKGRVIDASFSKKVLVRLRKGP